MRLLLRIFGWPHEWVHVLALLIIGRRPVIVRQTHVIIPDDLSTRQYVFVAGLPGLVFLMVFAVSVQALFNVGSIGEGVLWLVVVSIAALAGVGTLGDIQLIILRLTMARQTPPDDFVFEQPHDDHAEKSNS